MNIYLLGDKEISVIFLTFCNWLLRNSSIFNMKNRSLLVKLEKN